jgi:hypothetical protein
VSLARTCLTIYKVGAVKAIEDVVHQGQTCVLEDLLLSTCIVEDLVYLV